jgi:thioredoxin-related protein
MKPVRWIALSAAFCAALALGIFDRRTAAEDNLWLTDFKAAQAKAKQENKYLLVDFTGSDWCVWCKKLHKEVFDKEPFKAAAPKQFVLVELDFPQAKKLSDELTKQNKDLAEKYKVEGFPTVLLLDVDGQVIARSGYAKGGPEKYVKHLAEFSEIYKNVVALKGKLDKAEGLDRAKILDQIVEDYKKLENESDEVAGWCKEIIALDLDNRAGLKVKYEFEQSVTQARKLAESGKADAAARVLDAALAHKGVPGEMRQDGYMVKFEMAMRKHAFDDALAALKSAKEAAPESDSVEAIDDTLSHIRKIAEAKTAAAKLEPELEKSNGLDRAKLLDKLVEAKEKLAEFDPEAREQVAKWTKEIITVDADGKAGLKKKYEFKEALQGAMELIGHGKLDEAGAAVDKALETAGTTGEDVQAGFFIKAQVSMAKGNKAEGVESLKKALKAAPDSEAAASIKEMLADMDS